MDLISGLPEALIGHILSFLPTKQAASTSVLAKKWRYLFAFVHNLDFDSSVYVNPPKVKKILMRLCGVHEMVPVPKRNNVSPSFMDFVDRVLTLQGTLSVHKFSLLIRDGDDPVHPNRIFGWIFNVLERGVFHLDLVMILESESLLPPKVFLSETLVTLKMYALNCLIDVVDPHLPKLKTLSLTSLLFKDHGVGVSKLLSSCPVLEDLVLDDISWFQWDFLSVSVTTLKRLSFCELDCDMNPKSLTVDTPNLVYLEFTDTIANKYLKVNFGALVEAKIDLQMSWTQTGGVLFRFLSDGGNGMIGNATEFIRGICSVKILYLSASTLDVLTYSCESIPLFINLTHLTIESNQKVGWQSLPGLLENSPNLETLVLRMGRWQRLGFKEKDSISDVQIYFSEDEEENGLIGNATNFIMGIRNVKILCLSANTLQVLTHCCEALPVFDNLTHLTIESKPKVGWQSLPGLLKNSPNLETLVLQGLVHKATNRCGVVCLCKPYEGEEEEEEEGIYACLSSSPVKVLKITKFGYNRNHGIEKQIEQVKHFLETMPNLEQVILYYDTSVVEDVIEVSSQLRTIDNLASSKCSVQLISNKLKVPSSITMTLP